MNLAILYSNRQALEHQQALAQNSTSYPAIDDALADAIKRDEIMAAAAIYPLLKMWLDTANDTAAILSPIQRRLEAGIVGEGGNGLNVALSKLFAIQTGLTAIIAHAIPVMTAARDLVASGITNPPTGYASPTPEQLASPEFRALWAVMKDWDINVPGWYEGYTGCMGNHVMAVLNAMPVLKEDESGHEYKVPASMAAEFDRIMDGINATESYTDEWNDLCEQINDKFGEYRMH